MAETNPKLAEQWHPTKNGDLTPDDVTAGSNVKVWWKCNQGHDWKTAVYHRARGTGCPKCYHERMQSRRAIRMRAQSKKGKLRERCD